MAKNQCVPEPASRQLFESERRFRLLVEGVVDYAIFMLDPDGIVINWNAGAQRIQGYTADEIVGQHFGVFYTADDRADGLPERAFETARQEGKYAAEIWRVRKDGTRFLASVVIDPLYEDGALIGFAEVTRDVTERQTVQSALQESERNFRLLVSNVTDYALYMLDPEGRVSSWNAGGERIKGYAPHEIIGQNFSRFYTEADRAAGRPARALAIARETGRYAEEGWRVRKDGSFFWASVVIDPIRDDDGRLIGFAKITRDITERRDAEAALERVQFQLAESQKMDALGQLTGGVAHDFNNLLMVISGHIQTLKKIVADSPSGLRAAQAIDLAAERGATLTRQLLTFSRRQRLNPQPVHLRERIDSIREVLTSGLGGNISLLVDIDANLWEVTVDVGELEIALVNLVINARDAMPDGGMVTIIGRNITLGDGEVVLAGDYIAVTVEDTGEGIPEDILVKVFDPFFTTKPIGKGTGLGLSQVHGFAHQAGGTVKIASTLGKGTVLTIYLPRSSEELHPEGSEATAAGAGTGTVLLVEDNPDVAGASTGLLEELGYSVRWAPNAEAALEAIENDGIDLVFSDIVMPGRLDGLGLARIVRQRYPELPILLATGYSDAARGVRADFPILRKPYRVHELSQAIAELTRG
jgi:PAS domain S-box-containing protein